jgi:hypothetical protein
MLLVSGFSSWHINFHQASTHSVNHIFPDKAPWRMRSMATYVLDAK